MPQSKIQNLDQDIDAMSKEFALPASEVYEILRGKIRHMEGDARVREFLSLLAIKQVKDELRRRPTVSEKRGPGRQ